MKQIITAKLKLLTTPEQYHALRQTQLAYRDALNYVSRYAFEHGRMSNAERLHQGTYYDIRFQFKLPSEMTRNVIRQVGATYKGLWTKLRKNIEHRKAKITKKRFKGLDKPPKYVSPTVTYNYRYDYSFKRGQRVSILTLQGRVIIPYEGYDRHIALIQYGATIRASLLFWQSSTGESRSLRPTTQTIAAQRHSFSNTPYDRYERTRETVEAANKSSRRKNYCRCTPIYLDWARRTHGHSRAEATPQAETQGQADTSAHTQTASC